MNKIGKKSINVLVGEIVDEIAFLIRQNDLVKFGDFGFRFRSKIEIILIKKGSSKCAETLTGSDPVRIQT